jgi:hypothetical protein
MIPDHGSSSFWGKGGCRDGAISIEDAGAILKPLEGGQVNLFSIVHNIVAFMTIRVLAFLL